MHHLVNTSFNATIEAGSTALSHLVEVVTPASAESLVNAALWTAEQNATNSTWVKPLVIGLSTGVGGLLVCGVCAAFLINKFIIQPSASLVPPPADNVRVGHTPGVDYDSTIEFSGSTIYTAEESNETTPLAGDPRKNYQKDSGETTSVANETN